MNQWVLLAAAMVTLIAILYVPGFFFCRGMRFSRLVSVVCAPVISASWFVVLPIVFDKVGVACSGLLVAGGTLAICLGIFAISRLFARSSCELDVPSRSTIQLGTRTVSFEWLILAAYVAFGLFVCWYMLLSNLGTADAFYCRWDNTTHINTLRSFLDTGVWSTLKVDPYAASLPNQIPYESHGGFYPAAWHDTVITASDLVGISPLIVANALDAVLLGVVYPCGMFLLMKALFPENRRVVACGSVVCMSYAAFPWAFFLYGPYVANLFGQSMLPSVMAVFMLYLTSHLVREKPVSFLLFGATAFIGLAVGHPNTVFTALLYLGAFMCSYVYHAVGETDRTLFGSKRAAQVAGLLAVLAVIVVIWAVSFNVPALHNVVWFGRDPNSTVKHALATIASMGLSIGHHPMYALAPLTFVGGIVCLRDKRWWFLVPIAVMAVAYILIRTSEGYLKNYIAGFWYADVRRVTANMCTFLVPVTSVGADVATQWVIGLLERLAPSGDGAVANAKHLAGASAKRSTARREYVVTAVLVALFIVLNFIPWIPMPLLPDGRADTGIGGIREEIHDMFTPDEEQIYSHVERDFVNKVAEIVPEGELVLNQPHDGSVFAYGFNGLNTYFRFCRSGHMIEEAKTIRNRLVHYADDPEVQAAVEHTGAHYVLQLDQGGTPENRPWLVQYVNEQYYTGPEYWKGFNAIRDDTPGFTVVLSEGDMRLFRIDPVE